jgi:hypothetical protein
MMFSHSVLDELIMHLQQPQHAGFVAAHLAAEAYDVGEHHRRQATRFRCCCLCGFLRHDSDYAAGG